VLSSIDEQSKAGESAQEPEPAGVYAHPITLQAFSGIPPPRYVEQSEEAVPPQYAELPAVNMHAPSHKLTQLSFPPFKAQTGLPEQELRVFVPE
jgi:hypothetical protein